MDFTTQTRLRLTRRMKPASFSNKFPPLDKTRNWNTIMTMIQLLQYTKAQYARTQPEL